MLGFFTLSVIVYAFIGAVVLYGAPILAILLVLPHSQVTGLRGFLDAAKSVFTVEATWPKTVR